MFQLVNWKFLSAIAVTLAAVLSLLVGIARDTHAINARQQAAIEASEKTMREAEAFRKQHGDMLFHTNPKAKPYLIP